MARYAFAVCLERGWRCYDAKTYKWNLWWRSKGFPTSQCNQLDENQFINHVPHASYICRKDNLIRNLKCMKKIYGSIFDFTPDGFNLPSEYKKLLTTYKNGLETSENAATIWISKPVGLSQGRGITLFWDPSELIYSCNVLVQKYIEKPLLVSGYKFDLRLYILVPSFHPLTIYIYREGIVRFCTDKFSTNNLKNKFSHLTNSSVNKFSPRYRETKERIGTGCKWNLQQLRCYLRQTNGSDWLLWINISSLIVLTISSLLSKTPNTVNSFQLYGFDVLIDSFLKPWLIEVNSSPALCTDCIVDLQVKKPMIHDLFDLLGMPVCNTGLLFLPPDIPKSSSKVPRNIRIQKKQMKKKSTKRTSFYNECKKWENRHREFCGIQGNWVRVHPVLLEEHCKTNAYKLLDDAGQGSYITSEIKSVVSSTAFLLKIAKNVHKRNIQFDDHQCDCLMKPYLLQDACLWMPPI